MEPEKERVRSLLGNPGDNKSAASHLMLENSQRNSQEPLVTRSQEESLKIFIQTEDYFSSSSKNKYLIFFPERSSEFIYFKIDKKRKNINQTEPQLDDESERLAKENTKEGFMKIAKIKNKGWVNPANHSALITPKGDIYMMGGVDGNSNKTLPSLHKFNKSESLMELLVPMEQPRHSFSAVYCHRYIYVLGGSPGDDALALRSCEKYSIRNKNWDKIADMNVASIGATSCAFEEKYIFKIGGKKDKFSHNIEIERYTIENDRWDILRLRFIDKSKNLIPEKLPLKAGAFQVLLFKVIS